MTLSTEGVTTQALSLPEELILMLLNEESGYFHQVPGWDLNCTVAGAVLAELSLMGRIDTDVESLFIVDRTETGDPVLDPILKEIASEPAQHNTQYWIERLTPRAESIVDLTLDRLVDLNILAHHDGEFWTLSRTTLQTELSNTSSEGTAAQFVRTRISKVILNNEIPDPRDVIIIALIDTCDVFRFMFQLDDETEQRIQAIRRMDLIGRSIAEAVSQNIASPLLRRAALTKPIPVVPLRKLLLNPHLRSGNLSALFADIAKQYGPVFELRPPFSKRLIFLAGPETNKWVHRRGRMYFTAKDYFHDFENVFGAARTIHSLDGAEHFRYRKAMQPVYSPKSMLRRLDEVYQNARAQMTNWGVGDIVSAGTMLRLYMNSQMSPLMISEDTQNLIEDLIKYKERTLTIQITRILPKFMQHTPGMRRREKLIRRMVERIRSSHAPAQRAGEPRDLADDFLSLHASDSQFLPESDLYFPLATMLLGSMYLGDQLGFALYAMVSHPDLYERVREEADALFANGDPSEDQLNHSNMDVTVRLLMETLRLTPISGISMRNVMNTCAIEDYELPVGARVMIAQTASHYMEEAFPDPYKFDIDRYLPPRNEHTGPGYAPYGLGTHMCLGHRWAETHLAINLLMLAHYFRFEVTPANYKLRIKPFPSMSPCRDLKFMITERRHEVFA